ncbi:hypothetical protein V6N11_059008 [Hibiscus sabdariffa]|uniref:Uncharacterized protein n=1 Tax=Hibiscus sabdariffa TaxID=183260 RepID=A0ABR2U636_9ROSI
MGENVNLTLSSLTESSKEPVKIEKTPTNGTKRRKGKNPVEVSSTKGGVVFKKAFRNRKTKYLPYTKELRKIGGVPDDEDWDKVASFLPFLEIFYDTTLSFSGSRYATGNTFVEQIYDIGYTINRYIDDLQLNDGLRSMSRQMK